MITLKEIAKPNSKTKATQTVYEFYEGQKLVGKAVFMPTIWKSKLSLEIRHDNSSDFYKIWKSNWQSGGQSTFSKPNALKEFKHWYEFLTK